MNIKSCTLLLLIYVVFLQSAHSIPYLPSRGGASTKKLSDSNVFHKLALILESRLDVGQPVDVTSLEKALKSLSSAQQALKGVDGAAYEAYQRTRSDGGGRDLTSVSGRARRSAARMATTADAFLAAELCELIESDDLEAFKKENSTLANRAILLQDVHVKLTKDLNVTILLLWEPSYDGGAGLDHGGIKDLVRVNRKKRGRLLVVVKDPINTDLKGTFDILDVDHLELELNSGLVANEIASVNPYLYRAAGRILRSLEPTLMGDRFQNQTDIAIHFVGRSVAGGCASLAAVILDGSLPMPEEKKKKKSISKQANLTKPEISGFGRARSSAMVLGTPPCLSGNVKASFVKSLIFGDDVVCRITQESIERLCRRSHRALKGGIIRRRVGWMSDVVSMTVSSMKRHAHGSEGEEGRLVVPGQVFLVRPRKLGGVCSMHEVGGLKGGREALRAAILWQLNDILLSNSLWNHHQLHNYIEGLDKVQLRGTDVGDD
ncbi:hypothetical protein MHU86_10613 [Fragilaria crotonensis]|nr:hypothetical protein MHU86_10613 [Fragilaria crotonensis]